MTSKFIYVSGATVYGLDSEVGRDAAHFDIVRSSTCAAHISQVDWKKYQMWCTFSNGVIGALYKRNK